MFKSLSFLGILLLLRAMPAIAVPMYDEGALLIKGVQLLRDKDDKNGYYYVPQTPRLSTKADKSYELLFLKYTGKAKECNGGIFHALVEFSLPDSLVGAVEVELKKKNKDGRILGPVPMMHHSAKDGETVEPSFRIISATLSSNQMMRNVISSGKAPLTPGSKAAIAALLTEQGATLLWESLKRNTSDVSISLDAYYEAAVKGYNAVVTADMSLVYRHFSTISNKQSGYKKEQIRKVVDSLAKVGGLKVEVFDRSQSLGIKTGEMEAILNLVTNKLTEALFNLEKGWAVPPNPVSQDKGFREVGKVDDGKDRTVGQIGDYIYMGPFAGLFGSKFNNEYIPDDQYVLKDIKDIRTNSFVLNLSKSSTIKVPIHTAGNIGSVYSLLGNTERYFKIVNMDDAAFQRKEVVFQVDAKYKEGFSEWVNAVSVNFRKRYGDEHDAVTKSISFLSDDLNKGTFQKIIDFPRLGIATDDWDYYEYQVKWDLNRSDTDTVQTDSLWIKSHLPFVLLDFPLEKKEISLDVDKSAFLEKGVKTVQILFSAPLAGKKRLVRTVFLRSADAESIKTVAVYHDPKQLIEYEVHWYPSRGESSLPQVLNENNHVITLIPK